MAFPDSRGPKHKVPVHVCKYGDGAGFNRVDEIWLRNSATIQIHRPLIVRFILSTSVCFLKPCLVQNSFYISIYKLTGCMLLRNLNYARFVYNTFVCFCSNTFEQWNMLDDFQTLIVAILMIMKQQTQHSPSALHVNFNTWSSYFSPIQILLHTGRFQKSKPNEHQALKSRAIVFVLLNQRFFVMHQNPQHYLLLNNLIIMDIFLAVLIAMTATPISTRRVANCCLIWLNI